MAEDHEQALLEFIQRFWPEAESGPIVNQALIHRSYAFEHNLDCDNERLEFLGDSLIGFVASDYLYERYPDYNEGELSKIKATLVSRSMLGRRARDLGLGELLLLGKGEEKGGGRARMSLVGSALEALVGAILIERGLAAGYEFVRENIIKQVASRIDGEAFTDYKSRLQELVQKRHQLVPDYRTLEESGPDHDKRFYIEVSVLGEVCGRGWGQRKKAAENAAAREALAALSAAAE